MKDLVVLVADTDLQQVVSELLTRRTAALGIRPPTFDAVRASNRDHECWQRGGKILSGYLTTHRHALVVFDAAFEGASGAERLRTDVQAQLQAWEDRAAVVVVEPELEVWAFSARLTHLEQALGWDPGTLRAALRAEGWWGDEAKPDDPKGALQWAARQRRTTLNPRWFERLAAQVSTQGCTDEAFRAFTDAVTRWFPPPVPPTQ